MIPYGKPYRSATGIDLRAAMISAAGGAAAAIAAALFAWAWEKLGFPDFVFANLIFTTAFVQGLVLGLMLAEAYRRALLRSALVGAGLAIFFAFVSVVAVQEFRYLDYVLTQRAEAQAILARPASTVSPRTLAAAKELAAHPFQVVNRGLRQSTGYDGLLGFVFELNRVGEQMGDKDAMGSHLVKGQGLWVIWEVNTALVMLMALAIGQPRLSSVYCADCRRWYDGPERPLKIPPGGVGYLAAALKANDVHKIVNLQRVPSFDHEQGSAEVAMRSCKGCGQYLGEVILRTPSGKHFKETRALKLTSISPEMAFALKAGPELVPGAEEQQTPPWALGGEGAAAAVN